MTRRLVLIGVIGVLLVGAGWFYATSLPNEPAPVRDKFGRRESPPRPLGPPPRPRLSDELQLRITPTSDGAAYAVGIGGHVWHLFAGLRCAELGHLRVKDIDLASRRLTMVSGKGDKGRELPIFPRLEAILRAYLAEGRPALLAGLAPDPWLFVRGETVFPGRPRRVRTWGRRHAGRPLGGHLIFDLVRRVVEPIIGRPCHPHMLRHSFASRLRENGAPLELISECLGHAALTTTMIYAKITTKKRHEDLARYLEGPEEP